MRIQKLFKSYIFKYFSINSEIGSQVKFPEIKSDVFVKSATETLDYFAEKVPSTDKLFQNLNTAFERGKANIEPYCLWEKAHPDSLLARSIIYEKAQTELTELARTILNKSNHKKGVIAVLNALSKNEEFFLQDATAMYREDFKDPSCFYSSAAQYIIDSLQYADTPQKLNIIYKFTKNAHVRSYTTQNFRDCLEYEYCDPIEGRLKLIDKFTKKEFLPQYSNDDIFNLRNYYTKRILYEILKELKFPEQFELLDKVTDLNDRGKVYYSIALHIQRFSPEQCVYLSKLSNESKGKNLEELFNPKVSRP